MENKSKVSKIKNIIDWIINGVLVVDNKTFSI